MMCTLAGCMLQAFNGVLGVVVTRAHRTSSCCLFQVTYYNNSGRWCHAIKVCVHLDLPLNVAFKKSWSRIRAYILQIGRTTIIRTKALLELRWTSPFSIYPYRSEFSCHTIPFCDQNVLECTVKLVYEVDDKCEWILELRMSLKILCMLSLSSTFKVF